MVDPKDVLTAGAHLFEKTAPAVRTNGQGYMTSVCYSPTLDGHIGFGFLKSGPACHGEVIRMVDHLRGIETLAEVFDPVFFDPTGGCASG